MSDDQPDPSAIEDLQRAHGGMPDYDRQIDESLRLKLSGIVPPGVSFHRTLLYDEITELLPKDPKVRVGLYVVECLPRSAFSWHVHNGSVFFLVVQGEVELQYESGVERYRAGDVYTEPIGQIDRALNPNPTTPAVFIGFAATAADRQHVVNVGPPEWDPGLSFPE